MDALRSYHTTEARVVRGSSRHYVLRWYPAKPDALPYPGWSAFGSPVWEPDTDDEFSGPGVFHQPLQPRPKRYPALPGQHFHGEPDWFENGLPPSEVGKGDPDTICGIPAIIPEGDAEPGGESDIQAMGDP